MVYMFIHIIDPCLLLLESNQMSLFFIDLKLSLVLAGTCCGYELLLAFTTAIIKAR